MTALAGDTLASALLANGVRLVGRSFKYHRPRGVFTAGPEEPNALVGMRRGDRHEPNTRATMVELYDGLEAESQNRWPSLRFDVLGINDRLSPIFPAGFYYKTFMWPPKGWLTYEHYIRRAAGLGTAPVDRDPDRYEHQSAHCDVLVVGGGPARSEEHTSELQSRRDLVCRLLLEKKKKKKTKNKIKKTKTKLIIHLKIPSEGPRFYQLSV